jgi:hypothetical protein
VQGTARLEDQEREAGLADHLLQLGRDQPRENLVRVSEELVGPGSRTIEASLAEAPPWEVWIMPDSGTLCVVRNTTIFSGLSLPRSSASVGACRREPNSLEQALRRGTYRAVVLVDAPV